MDPSFSVVYRKAAEERVEVHVRLHDGLLFHRRIHGGGLPRLRLHKSTEFGVWFTPVRTVRMVTDIWMQVFDAPLPDVPVMQDDIRHAVDYTPNCTGNMPVRRRVRCREDRAVYIAVHDLYTNMTREVIKTLEHLHDLLPSEKSITTAGISKRALAPFVGWIMRGLFGTATVDELLPIETQIRRIAQGVVMMAEGLEVQNNRLVGFMSMAVDDISNIINMTV